MNILRPILFTSLLLVVLTVPVGGQSVSDWTVSSTPIVEIGRVEGPSEYLFGSIGTARLLPNQRIVVSDREALSVRVFGPDGELQASMGRAGEGPGEFESMFGLWVVPPDTIEVWDPQAARITRFSADGSLIATQRVYPHPPEAPDGILDLPAGRLPGGEVALAWTVGRTSTTSRMRQADQTVLGRFGADGRLIRILGTVSGMVRSQGSPIVFTPFPYADRYRDTVYVTNGVNGDVFVFDPAGGLERSFTLPAESIGGSEAWDMLENTLSASGDTATLNLVRSRVRAEQTPALGGMFIDHQGLLWAKVYDPATDPIYTDASPWGGGGEWLVSRRDGQVMARVQLPTNVAPLDVRGDRMLGLSRDALGVERLVIHRLER